MIRAGEGPPLVLLHGVMSSERAWERVVPLLIPHHDTIALTALGHRGGTPRRAPVTIAAVVDDTERSLDELGLDRPHLAGNSLGGWVALELARRGRAASVCALSPAGCWDAAAKGQRHAASRLRRAARLTRAFHSILPLVARSGLVRRIGMHDAAAHGERATPRELIEIAEDLLGCTVRGDLLRTSEQLGPLDPLPCPVVLAWSARDRLLPPAVNGARARELMPQASYRELPDVGHVPMIDDPELVAATILETAGLAV